MKTITYEQYEDYRLRIVQLISEEIINIDEVNRLMHDIEAFEKSRQWAPGLIIPNYSEGYK